MSAKGVQSVVVEDGYLALDSCRLIITVGGGAQRGTKSLTAGDSFSLQGSPRASAF